MLNQAHTILVVDSDEEFSTLLVDFLALERFTPSRAHSLGSAYRLLALGNVECLLISSSLPDGKALDWLQQQQAHGMSLAPTVLIIQAGDVAPTEAQRQQLHIEAVISRPCSLLQLSKTLSELLNENNQLEHTLPTLSFHGLEINPLDKTVHYKGSRVELTNSEFSILEVLLSKADRAVTKDYIYQRAFGRPMHVNERVIDVHISAIRHKLRAVSEDLRIEGLRRIGYMLCLNSSVEGTAPSEVQSK
mgnify:CR=1 FL=1